MVWKYGLENLNLSITYKIETNTADIGARPSFNVQWSDFMWHHNSLERFVYIIRTLNKK